MANGVETQSVQSLHIEMRVRDQVLASGTAFVGSRNGEFFLITNRHNLAGRRSDTNELMSPTGAVPDTVRVHHSITVAGGLGWMGVDWSLRDDEERPLWFEHPVHGRAVDVVAFPIDPPPTPIVYHPYAVEASPVAFSTRVTTDVHVVGFPFGMTGGGYLALWTRGSIASEWHADFEGLPSFLIDARTRRGQSGSPVIIHNIGGLSTASDGGMRLGGPTSALLGVYSGRINEESDLGRVWKMSTVAEIVDGRHRPEA